MLQKQILALTKRVEQLENKQATVLQIVDPAQFPLQAVEGQLVLSNA